MKQSGRSQGKDPPIADLPPPPGIPEREAKLWREILAATQPGHIGRQQAHLLESLCASIVRHEVLLHELRRIMADAEGVNPVDGKLRGLDMLAWKEAQSALRSEVTIMSNLSMRLRLVKPSREKSNGAPMPPWLRT